jgi:carbamoyl-phosphate synthase large subunit
LQQIKKLVDLNNRKTQSISSLRTLKHNGFSDRQIGRMTGKTEIEIRAQRKKESVYPAYKVVDTCAAEFVAQTPYCY